MPSLSDLTSKCIRCGFCLEACPTFVISGRETESPRGRIYLAKLADEGKIEWADSRHAFDTCLGCRACEPACPSGVEYGKILDHARHELGGYRPLLNLIDRVSDPEAVRLAAKVGRFLPGGRIPSLALRGVSGEPSVAQTPRIPKKRDWPTLDESAMPEVKGEVYLLEGCAMRVLYQHVHTALRRLLRRVGYVVRDAEAGCCGALHTHNGFNEVGVEKMRALFEAMGDDLPIIVDSAGCGSVMKDWSRVDPILASPKGQGLSSSKESGRGCGRNIFDACEFLFDQGLQDELKNSMGVNKNVTYHDACHLAHAQGIRNQPRELLKAVPNIEFIELNESDMCCGSAGVYNFTQPSRAQSLLDRKTKNILATRAEVVATGNPGCLAWIEQGSHKVRVRHTLEVLEASFSGNLG